MGASIDVDASKVAREFALVLRDEAPLWELVSFGPFDEQATNFVPSELKPVHVVRQVEEEVVAISV